MFLRFLAHTRAAPTRGRCEQIINKGDAVVMDDKAYHAECFVCAKCSKPFPDGVYMPSAVRSFVRHCCAHARALARI